MKIGASFFSIALILNIVLAIMPPLDRKEKACCLCDSFIYHAPCLIDLETGEVVELDLYFPHRTKGAELAEVQPEQYTISFVRCGNTFGLKATAAERVELDVPTTEKTGNPALCKECRKLLPTGYLGRYVLADLRDRDAQKLIPVWARTERTIRCYDITMVKNPKKKGVSVIVQGTLRGHQQ